MVKEVLPGLQEDIQIIRETIKLLTATTHIMVAVEVAAVVVVLQLYTKSVAVDAQEVAAAVVVVVVPIPPNLQTIPQEQVLAVVVACLFSQSEKMGM